MTAGPLGPSDRLLGPTGTPIELVQTDALLGLRRRIAPGSVDVVVTSPPYNLGAAYRAYDDRRPRAEYLRWIRGLGRAVDRALAPDGSFFLNLGGPPSDPGWPWEVARAAGRGLVLQNVIHWVKSIAIERAAVGRRAGLSEDLAIGHYKPVHSTRYLNSAHEYIFHLTHRGDVPLDRLAIGVPYQDESNIARWGSGASGRRCRGNAWFLPYPTIRRRSVDRPHPASFPVELPERCLLLHGKERIRLAVDPFVGIGASALAAARVGVPFVGFEIDRGYLDEAIRLLQRAGARPAGGGAFPELRPSGASRSVRPVGRAARSSRVRGPRSRAAPGLCKSPRSGRAPGLSESRSRRESDRPTRAR